MVEIIELNQIISDFNQIVKDGKSINILDSLNPTFNRVILKLKNKESKVNDNQIIELNNIIRTIEFIKKNYIKNKEDTSQLEQYLKLLIGCRKSLEVINLKDE